MEDQIQLIGDEMLKINNVQEVSTLVFWKQNASRFEMVVSYAKMHLCLIATSIPSEKTFRSATFLYSAERANLDESDAEKIVFIRQNMHFVDMIPRDILVKKLLERGTTSPLEEGEEGEDEVLL